MSRSTNEDVPRKPTRRFHARSRMMLSLFDAIGRLFVRDRTGSSTRDPLWIVAACALVPALTIASLALGALLN